MITHCSLQINQIELIYIVSAVCQNLPYATKSTDLNGAVYTSQTKAAASLNNPEW